MPDNYAGIVRDNLQRLYAGSTEDLANHLPAKQSGDRFVFEAFGDTCEVAPGGITLGGGPPPSVLGILITLYALHACPDRFVLQPFKAFKEFPDAAPYVGAFAIHTEQLLAPHADKIGLAIPEIVRVFNGEEDTSGGAGDFSFIVYPFPKVALRYIFYEADEEFPASVVCLFSSNAERFLPMDGLADTGEYTSKKILALVK
jgi:hypothetical protein